MAATTSPKKAASGVRRIRRPKYTPLHIGKRVKVTVRRLPSVWWLTKQAARVLWQHKGLLAGITLVYGLLNLLLVQGLSSGTDVTGLKDSLNQAFTGQLHQVASSLTVFAVL